MTNIQKRIASAAISAVMLLNLAVPVLASTLEISGNGSGSDNDVVVDIDHSTTVLQSNEADVINDINVTANTGGNTADKNTGGDVSIDTGDAEVTVDVENNLNTNSADVDCACGAGDIDVLISGNGSDSDNKVDLDVNQHKDSGTFVDQINYADVRNRVVVAANTGDNDADKNTGGDVEIGTGDAVVDVSISTAANANSARIGGGDGSGSLSARILGNGSNSDNDIVLDYDHSIGLLQSNEADVKNRVGVIANTGLNTADKNTGGDVEIGTGDAEVDVTIDNMVNFNFADVDCGCLLDVLAKIAGNGVDSHNDIVADLTDDLFIGQANCGGFGTDQLGECELDNGVTVAGNTGDNDSDKNTGDVDGGDPSIETGDSEVEVNVENSGNANIFGDGFDFELPGGFSFNLNIDLDLSDLLDFLS